MWVIKSIWLIMVVLGMTSSTMESSSVRITDKNIKYMILGDGKWRSNFRPHHYDHRHWGPFFEEAPANASGPSGFSSGGDYAIAAPAGSPLQLDCRVAMLHDKMVMWVKKTAERVSLLTVGPALYSADSRISLRFQYPNNWRLEISPVQESDEGVYMCQLSTHPPRVRATNLTVLNPEVMIVDEHGVSLSERHYQESSRIELLCRAQISTSNPKNITGKLTWLKDGEPTLLPLKSTTISSEPTVTIYISRLVIPVATPSDSGLYSCKFHNRGQAFINVHVLQGETQAAVHHEASHSCRAQTAVFIVLATIFTFC